MATYDERQTAAITNTVVWLEDELREAKLLIVKQQQELDQLKARLWDVTDTLHRAEDAVATLAPRLDLLPPLEMLVHQLRDQIADVHEHGLLTDSRLTELARVQTTEAERDRAVLNDHSHRLDAVERGQQSAAPRFDALDEASRRAIETATFVRQRLDELARTLEGIDGRISRVAETGGRTDQEFARINAELETLRRQDTTIGERVQTYTEILRRLEAQISIVSSEVAVKQDVLERIELGRIELHRLEERISVLEAVGAELREIDEDLRRQTAMLDGRDKGLYDRLTGLQSEMASYRAVVAEQFQRLHQAQERAKRRQIEDLEREIREMRIHAFRSVEEQP